MKLFALICTAGFLLGGAANAATFTALASIGPLGCDERDSSSTSASVRCGSFIAGSLEATAFASSGGGATSAFASAISRRDLDGFGTFITPSNSFATSSDSITATWTNTGAAFNGSLVFDFDLLGAVDSGDGFARATASFFVGSASIFSYDSVLDGAPDVVTSSSSVAITGTSSFRSFASAEARACNIVDRGETCFSSSDLGSSLRVTGLSFFDTDGNDVTSSLTVVSESGFDYVTGAASHDRGATISPVPLPASAWMLLAALGGLFGMNQVRSRLSIA